MALPEIRWNNASSRVGKMRRWSLLALLVVGATILAACGSTEDTTTTTGQELGVMVETFQAEQVAVAEEDPGGLAFLIITCESRDSNGNCTEASCERELLDVEPGFETESCAAFLVGCADAGHTATGNQNGATCKAQGS